jgi:hypothetical protein
MKRRTIILSASAALTAACGGEKGAEPAASAAPTPSTTVGTYAYRKQQQDFADSVLNAASSAKQVADRLGKGYEVGPPRLRDSVAAHASRSDCLKVGRETDPYLSGSVAFWVNMGVVGSDVVRPMESSWTSPVGKQVDACLAEAALKWKFDRSYANMGAYIVTIQFRDAPAAPAATKQP